MQTEPSPVAALPSASSFSLHILVLYSSLAVITATSYYLGGIGGGISSSVWPIVSWAYAAAFAFVLEFGRLLCLPPRIGAGYRLLYLGPAVVQTGQSTLTFISYTRVTASYEIVYLILAVFDCGLAVIGIRLLISAYRSRAFQSPSDVVNRESAPTNYKETNEVIVKLLGQGSSYIDRVINSIIGRSLKSERIATFSLIIMLFLVSIGGMASFGLWAFTHADRISSIENERNKLVTLQAELQGIKESIGTNNQEITYRLDRLLKFIDQNYKTSPSYESTLNRLSQQSQSNYADIAIRVTIAVLTIFLVQVFFAVYKYNRHLAIMLAAKAEALELVGSDDDARKNLSREAVSIVKETVPGFGSQPRTPLEEITRFAEKVGKR